MRRVSRRLTRADDATQSAASSQTMTEEQTAGLCHGSQEPNSTALVHVITPRRHPLSIHLSILPSFLSRLPLPIHTLRISFILSHSWNEDWEPATWATSLSNLPLERVKNAVQKDGVIHLGIHLRITFYDKQETAILTFLEIEGHSSNGERDVKSGVDRLDSCASYGDPFTLTFPVFRENAIFAPIASYSLRRSRFLPIGEDYSSSLPFHIIQLSVPFPNVTPCSISRLPAELLSLIFSFSDSVYTISDVCELWREVSAPYSVEPDFLSAKYEQLKRYPDAGRLWKRLHVEERMDVAMVKEVIAGSPNVTEVSLAFWNEDEAKIVLNAIEGLKHVNNVKFWGRSRKCREEIENFVRRMGDRIYVNTQSQDC